MATTSRSTAANRGTLSPQEWAEVVKRQQISRELPEHEGSGWSGLELRPKNFRFYTQNKGEKVFILLRTHWLTNLGWIVNNLIYCLVPLILAVILRAFSIELSAGNLLGIKLVIVLLLTYYSVIFTNVLRHFTDWYYNLFIVTNERIIDYDFQSLTSRGASEIALENIEDVSEHSVGFLPNMFNYGDVLIYSAAEKSAVTFSKVPRPTFVRDKITDLANIAKKHSDES